ncbi:uncharacterized protein LOC111909101 [Lactuca sativa]|uniref:uncharacterized protein LOC111909101 n=1 Tax=Lactuca sativa TaxID=4236 RepID=UPI000CD9BAEC|nr:uncharacterized protein LOC111909101 [Lactuca sativa]
MFIHPRRQHGWFPSPGDPYFPNQGNNGWLEESEEESEEEPEEDSEEESEGEPEAEAEGGPTEPVVDQEEEEAEGGLEEEPSENEDGDSDADSEVINSRYPVRVPAYRLGPTRPTPPRDAYISKFSELSLLCPGTVTSEGKKIERFIWGLTSLIQGNVIAAKLETFDSAKRLAKKMYDHNNKKGEKPAEIEGKKENDNKKGNNNKRKGRQGSESAKKQ